VTAPSPAELEALAGEIEIVSRHARALYASIQPFRGCRSKADPPGSPDVVEQMAPIMNVLTIVEAFARGARAGVERLPDAASYRQLQTMIRGIRQGLTQVEERFAIGLGPYGWKLPPPPNERGRARASRPLVESLAAGQLPAAFFVPARRAISLHMAPAVAVKPFAPGCAPPSGNG
jgi:hypothetical protein